MLSGDAEKTSKFNIPMTKYLIKLKLYFTDPKQHNFDHSVGN